MVDVDICNLALSYLGDSATVASIKPPEGSAQAQHCARFYPMALNLMLEAHQWNFATKRAYLAVAETCYFNAWRYAYAVPSDATGIISVVPKCEYTVCLPGTLQMPWSLAFEMHRREEFELETSNGRQVILSNAKDAVARYTVATVQPGAFPAQFADALAWKLASMLAGPLIKGDAGAAESKRCLAMHQAVLEQAKGQDANQKYGSQQPLPNWVAARA